ncbi:hypothetical protein TNCV_4749311 [Trichonephila clavipes]|nr:hypothetical protein TNCV_4749311 [Trichonephila clavipes]
MSKGNGEIRNYQNTKEDGHLTVDDKITSLEGHFPDENLPYPTTFRVKPTSPRGQKTLFLNTLTLSKPRQYSTLANSSLRYYNKLSVRVIVVMWSCGNHGRSSCGDDSWGCKDPSGEWVPVWVPSSSLNRDSKL